MWPDRESNLGPLALGTDALPTALRGPANACVIKHLLDVRHTFFTYFKRLLTNTLTNASYIYHKLKTYQSKAQPRTSPALLQQ